MQSDAQICYIGLGEEDLTIGWWFCRQVWEFYGAGEI